MAARRNPKTSLRALAGMSVQEIGELLSGEYRARRNPKAPPMHPGELLREDVLPALGKKKGEIARLLGISRQTLREILAERQHITPAMALRLGKLCGNGPTLWLNLQRGVDLWKARRSVKIERIPTLEAHY